MSSDCVQYGTTVIDYSIEYAQRKTLNICVNPDGAVFIKVPVNASSEQIRQKVHKRAAWILRQRRFFESFGTPTGERLYVSGESHLYLGRQYMLRVREGNINSVRYQSNIIEIECKHKKDAAKILQRWYLQRANVKFQEYAQVIAERFGAYGVKPKRIYIRKRMDKRWGYCSPNGNIALNLRLICAPRGCIEYVITHEMCHLVHRKHSADFYALLSKEMPHWERWKNKLERILI